VCKQFLANEGELNHVMLSRLNQLDCMSQFKQINDHKNKCYTIKKITLAELLRF